ncbi:MAG: tyrosine-type recombinase/integrase [Actinopolymorphaceae bacterium]
MRGGRGRSLNLLSFSPAIDCGNRSFVRPASPRTAAHGRPQGRQPGSAPRQRRLEDYAEKWIAQRPALSRRTVELYESLLANHIRPHLGGVPLGRLDTPLIREWRAKLLAGGVSANVAAKAYRLLRAVLTTAVNEDAIIPRNPCRIPGADKEHWNERPVLSLTQVLRLADEMPQRFRAMILLAAFTSLGYGEITALERRDLDLKACTVRVRQAFTRVRGGGLVLGPPKSRAGLRTVSLPLGIVAELTEHLEEYVDPEPSALVFTGPKGAWLQRQNFNKLVRWETAVAKVGASELHFHDLRHTGNTWAAASRASTRDLMVCMGHDSVRAALIYQHATSEAGQAIASAMDLQMRAARAEADAAEEANKSQETSGKTGGDGEAGAPDPTC